MPSGINRRNFMVRAGAVSGALALAGCTGGTGGDGNGDGNGGGGGGGSTDDGSRPLKWMGPAWAVRDGQAQKYTEMTGIDVETTTADIPTTQQKLLSGDRANFDAFSIDSSGAGALTKDNDASLSVPKDALDKWDEEKITELFTNPGERVSYLGAQTDTMLDELWADDEKTELRFPPHVYNFDAIGLNPKFVDESSVSKWSALFDEQYKGKVAMGATSAISIPEALMHLMDNDMIEGEVGDLNNPSEDQLDAAVDFLIKQKQSGQFRSTWVAYGNSVNLMSSEEAIIGDIWQPACLDVRRAGTPCTYATMEDGIQGYRYWFGGIAPLNPGASDRNNVDEVHQLINDVHYGAWFPGFIQGWGYSVPHYPNKELVRDGSDDSGEGMGPEYYDWAYEGKATYQSVDEPGLFDPQQYEWSMEEGSPASDGQVRNSGPVEERIDRIGFFQIWPSNADYMLERWKEFTSA
ncbi:MULTISPECIES: substrate-binding domain-containing protein [unclassified Haladaptatus]|uniref:substrate-binding domain-containing protein n=1 Tax=unclassified Haladaptatus TaxID=2622732 RepID=UPI0023E8DA3F|nr:MULTISPECIES: substrate-binding domain-containing protein [unclassified Haladaptatus]